MNLDLRFDADGVLSLSGELDVATAESFVQCGTTELERSDELRVELSDLAFIDSSGIRAILALAERANGSLVLCHPRENVRKVIDLTGIVGRHGIVVED